MRFIFKLLKFIKNVVIIAVLLFVFLLPFEKAESNDRVVLINPITLRYISMTISSKDGMVERDSITYGVASCTTNEEGETSYIFGYSLAAYAIDAGEFSMENNAGKYDYKTVVNLILTGTGY